MREGGGRAIQTVLVIATYMFVCACVCAYIHAYRTGPLSYAAARACFLTATV
jgi:hypothetical protein